jgi:hypothetical protein
MPDILVIRDNGRTKIHGVTRKGSMWLADWYDPAVTLNVPNDLAPTIIDHMKKANLDVDER